MRSTNLASLPSRDLWLFSLIAKLSGCGPRGDKLRALWEERGKVCYYCHDPISINEASRDHATPRSKGGDSSPGNIRLACVACNSVKQDRTEPEYWALLAADRAEWGTDIKRPLTKKERRLYASRHGHASHRRSA